MIETLAELGVTRLSLGGQSFRDEKLRLLERDHSGRRYWPGGRTGPRRRHAGGARSHFRDARRNARPMGGRPRCGDRARAGSRFDLRPDVRARHGVLEPAAARRTCAKSTKNLQRDMYALAIDRLTAAGFEHYEVSNFARPGCRSRHNQVYWSGDGYYRRRARGGPLRRRRPRDEPPQHDDLSAARARRRVAGGRA